MKFAKELDRELVPEWRTKYLNYKAGKKYVKGVSRAISRANVSPLGIAKKGDLPPRRTPGTGSFAGGRPTPVTPAAPGRTLGEQQSLSQSPGNIVNYGSVQATPPAAAGSKRTSTFELPDPAMSNVSGPQRPRLSSSSHGEANRSMSADTGAAGVPSRPGSLVHPDTSSPGRLRRLLSGTPMHVRAQNTLLDLGMQDLDTVRRREQEFFEFLDRELNKVEKFYKMKEEQANKRLAVLREQLHAMRNQRTEEMAAAKQRRELGNQSEDVGPGESGQGNGSTHWFDSLKDKAFKPGPNSKALSRMVHTPVISGRSGDASRDYIRRPQNHKVPYRTAKRKLKLALQEFYRGLELLKSYAILNRTAFRKLNKKYDKAVNARPPYRYMNEKVGKAWFVNSDLIDGHIQAVEDLYARYFEKGNRKIAAGKLRRMSRRPNDSGMTFNNGLLIGVGAVLTIEGLLYGIRLLKHPDDDVREETSYLMQIYGGYFLVLTLFSLFCLNCFVWTKNKVNYHFIFEFDPRHQLDWRELSVFPSFFLLLFGLFFRLNFSEVGDPKFNLYYPVVLIAISVFIVFLPFPFLWHRSRKWFAYSHFRLLLAGLYPVEFRDFFLGDMYCSLTYAVMNIELFFCLYARSWDEPSLCNSSNSRLMGFFGALPPIWRALQCVRRYRDTRNIFPHLVNCGKYAMSIMAAVTLSLYRINGTDSNLGLFVTFSLINAIYCSTWDLFMDFSLLQPDNTPDRQHVLLRDITALKRKWIYYAIMVIDPILRFAWIFYAIFTYDKQHSTIVSFLVGLVEVLRRGMWTLLRVENEHCANVAQYKASRDLPLPYKFQAEQFITHVEEEPQEEEAAMEAETARAGLDTAEASGRARGETGPSAIEGGTELRLRRSNTTAAIPRAKSIRGLMAAAHKQDFEKKRRPVEQEREEEEAQLQEMMTDDEDEDEEEEADDVSDSEAEERADVQRVESLVRDRGSGLQD